eukprot:CAMPEP_0180545574 /NCGR_PEP_ID=MMETSP1036_2-20121128/70109_1 /TAXON_ID=632150 /ORGANISM="Azadinium spinosum, Strain 3D9" /LENGTH=69 /DNA_ID=CAMNT_0022560619 /DNA_START=286 /DNA_END=495 /DNA_ORIENTATION=-
MPSEAMADTSDPAGMSLADPRICPKSNQRVTKMPVPMKMEACVPSEQIIFPGDRSGSLCKQKSVGQVSG